MHSSVKVLPQQWSQVEVWTLCPPSNSVVDLLYLGVIDLLYESFTQALAIRLVASYLTQILEEFMVLWLQRKPKSSPLIHYNRQLVCVCSDLLCLVLPKYGAVHYGQTVSLWSSLLLCLGLVI